MPALSLPRGFVERDVFVARRAKGIEHARLLRSFDAVRNIAREVIGVARAQFVRSAIREDFHPSREDMDDLFLRMFVLRHFAAGLQLGEHLIHRLAVGHRATPNSRADVDPRIFFGRFAHDACSKPRSRSVQLLQRAANDFTGLEGVRFDTVILNSVVQYFPSIDYLTKVLEGALRVLKPGGRLFVGDVRSLPLLETFHTSVEMQQAPDDLPLALLRQRIFYVWRRAELLARIHSHQLAHNRIPARQTRRTRDPWEEQLLAAEDNPLRQIALKNDLTMIRHFDQQIFALEEELQRQTKKVASRDYALLQSVPGIGENLGLTILYEIGDIERFPTVKDFLSYSRLVKGTVASAGKIKGLRGAKLGNPYLRWAFGEAAVIAKRDHFRIRPLAQRLEEQMNGNKFKANTVVAIKLARAVYFMLKNKTVFDPDRLVAALARN